MGDYKNHLGIPKRTMKLPGIPVTLTINMATPSQNWDKKNIAVPLGPSMQDNPGTNQKPAKNLPWQVF